MLKEFHKTEHNEVKVSFVQLRYQPSVDLKADKMTMERFLPTTTTVQNTIAGVISTFSATQVVLSTTHVLTQLGNAIAIFGSNVLHFFRNRPDSKMD